MHVAPERLPERWAGYRAGTEKREYVFWANAFSVVSFMQILNGDDIQTGTHSTGKGPSQQTGPNNWPASCEKMESDPPHTLNKNCSERTRGPHVKAETLKPLERKHAPEFLNGPSHTIPQHKRPDMLDVVRIRDVCASKDAIEEVITLGRGENACRPLI